MEMTERKKKVLRSVVDLYIRTAEPVGSKAIAELPDMRYSSATIRNEMADLTTMGLLEQPHTSAGRIPSAAGYRLYVDEVMADYRLSMDETKSINTAIEEKMQRMDKMMGPPGFPGYGPARHLRHLPANLRRREAVRPDLRRSGKHHPGASAGK